MPVVRVVAVVTPATGCGGKFMNANRCAWRMRWTAAVAVAVAAGCLPGVARAQPRATSGDWESYAVFDTLFMQRENQTNDGPLVLDGDTQAAAIATPDLQFPTAPGIRALYGQHGPAGLGWEIGYLGVYGMFADASAAGNGNLEIAPPLSSAVASLRGASAARATYASVLNSAEANVLLTERCFHRPRHSAYAAERIPCAFTVDWLAGFRWAGLDEQAALAFGGSPASLATGYAVRTSSNLFGGQLGVRGRADLQAWAVEGWVKAALAGSMLAQSQDPIIDSITGDVYRSARGSRTQTPGGIFDVGATLVYRLSDTWGLRFGYSMLWLTNVALAPDQFDFTADTEAGTRLDGNQTLWLGGATLGLEARW
jgi:hypothetical protein